MKKNKKKDGFGWARTLIVIMLLLMGIIYLIQTPLLGFLFILVMIYIMGMDKLPGKRNAEKVAEEPAYDPSELGEMVKCPFCGKEIPSEINFCYYCGRSLEEFKRVEAVRTSSLTQMDSTLAGMAKGANKTKIAAIRDLTDKILVKFEQTPEEDEGCEKFMDYYLPKTVAAIKHYGVLCSLDNLDAGEKQIKNQLENSFDLLEEAFSNIYNRASTEGLEDVSTDISALENIVKLEGLADSDFKQ